MYQLNPAHGIKAFIYLNVFHIPHERKLSNHSFTLKLIPIVINHLVFGNGGDQ